ncbi:exodeoxyribonuclease VII small subunit [Deinococcus sp.]|uniref:exodeoxyribonuclease VII small subunit n=1 Tax=Deinococcus sp. TaxID=47478 RepID=UPI0025FEDE0A|nr:exodeoxyribonuclease VII small subunit [Deinococcus sp.]
MSTRKTPPGAAKIQSYQTQTYRAAFDQLTRIAAELEEGETDLDRVLPLLAEAQAAYEVCRGRIEALRTALGGETPAPNLQGTDADSEDDPNNQETDDQDNELEDFF